MTHLSWGRLPYTLQAETGTGTGYTSYLYILVQCVLCNFKIGTVFAAACGCIRSKGNFFQT